MSAQRLRPRLVAVWLVFAALVAAIAVLEYGERRAADEDGAEAGSAGGARLMPVPLADVAAVEIGHAGALHRFERDAGGAWLRHAPHDGATGEHRHQADPAAAVRIAKVLGAFERTRIERRLALEGDPGRYGLAVPRTVLLLYRAGEAQPLAQYAFGDVAPDTHSRYVLRIGAAEALTIPDYQLGNLLTLVP